MSNRSTMAALFGAAMLMGVGLSGHAMAKGCIKGAVVGGVAGHVAGHHGAMGAAAGCAVGHHEAAKKAKADSSTANPPS